MRQSLCLFATAAFLLTEFALAPAPAAAAPLVVQGQAGDAQWELVKKKKKKASEDDAEDEDPSSRGLMDYFTGSFKFGQEWSEEVEDNLVVTWILGALFSGLGGHIWAPMIFYKDVPDNGAKKNAMILGIIATVLYWIPGVFPLLIPGIYFWTIGFWLFLLWVGIVECFIMPRAVAMATSDAYKLGGDGGDEPKKKKKKKKKKADDEDEE
ncbi:MAG: hypothetical protein HY904_00875 [Deltaproteobacteria bacterium]|nr:hypothetical protein [Deltaproteobacteria bacterium]